MDRNRKLTDKESFHRSKIVTAVILAIFFLCASGAGLMWIFTMNTWGEPFTFSVLIGALMLTSITAAMTFPVLMTIATYRGLHSAVVN